jgi:hypothetical protein
VQGGISSEYGIQNDNKLIKVLFSPARIYRIERIDLFMLIFYKGDCLESLTFSTTRDSKSFKN